jgi:Domain of Unknown Function (DUF1080)
MRLALVFLLLLPALFAQPNALTPQEIADGWVLLFDGTSFFGWTQEGKAEWRIVDGALVADSPASGWLRHNATFADFILKVEFRTPAENNSGVFLRSARDGVPQTTGYEVQIADANPKFPTGSLVDHIPSKPIPAKPDQWRGYEMEAMGDRFVIKLDGQTVLDGRDGKSRVGHVGLQYNRGRKVEFRSVKLKPLGLTPIFTGKDLSGWQIVDAPKAPEKPVWVARDGVLHVEKGPGQIETESTYDDFVLQLEIRTNTKDANLHPNSGVFFRGNPKGYWTGYESQIRNEYKGNDRGAAVDFGTGGIYYRQPARRVVSNDNEFFSKTVVARGRHITTWINGIPVADWEDFRAEGMNAREEARLAPGPISLQAHDPTTNLDFRNIRIVAIPKQPAAK